MTPTAQDLRIDRLRTLASKMLRHADYFVARIEEERVENHWDSKYHQDRCTKCWTLECQYHRWHNRWYNLYKTLPPLDIIKNKTWGWGV